MGMFDTVILDVNILPDLTEEEKKILNDQKDWQTKSFENVLTEIYIVEDKEIKFRHSFLNDDFRYKLQIKESDWEETPIDERPYNDVEENRLQSLFGSMRETNIRIVDLNYTGSFRFYSYIKKILEHGYDLKWYEFEGEAENGKIKSLKRI
jgi:hypothetical protein